MTSRMHLKNCRRARNGVYAQKGTNSRVMVASSPKVSFRPDGRTRINAYTLTGAPNNVKTLPPCYLPCLCCYLQKFNYKLKPNPILEVLKYLFLKTKSKAQYVQNGTKDLKLQKQNEKPNTAYLLLETNSKVELFA
jgi:hypothetical protein